MLVLFACDNSAPKQIYTPQAVTRDDIGYYCNMIVEDHSGPKRQILLTGRLQAVPAGLHDHGERRGVGADALSRRDQIHQCGRRGDPGE